MSAYLSMDAIYLRIIELIASWKLRVLRDLTSSSVWGLVLYLMGYTLNAVTVNLASCIERPDFEFCLRPGVVLNGLYAECCYSKSGCSVLKYAQRPGNVTSRIWGGSILGGTWKPGRRLETGEQYSGDNFVNRWPFYRGYFRAQSIWFIWMWTVDGTCSLLSENVLNRSHFWFPSVLTSPVYIILLLCIAYKA